MYNFFVNSNDIYDYVARISGDDYNHIKNVLRMKIGAKILINDKEKNKTYLTKIQEVGTKEIFCKIIDRIPSNEMIVKVSLFQGIPKADKMEYIIQKSVELGVNEIVPTEMKNCVAKINNEENKLIRWNKISETAAKQSKRSIIPKIENKISFNTLLDRVKKFDLAIVAYENEKHISLRDVLNKHQNINNIAIIVGPEGGIDKNELNLLENAGVKTASLGKRILRTETAPIAMLSMILYEYEM
jgi:16S rRNA (uracil1498-N3)-methyltransferase